MHITLSNRARRQVQLAAFGATALITTLAIASPAGAAGTSTSVTATQRITVTSAVSCSESGIPSVIDFSYDDHVDGHVPQTVHEELIEGATDVDDGLYHETVVWTRDDLYQENGDYFNTVTYPQGGATLNPTGRYTYIVTITYDDGVTQTQSTTVDVATAQCPDPPSTTTPAPPPPTQAPSPDRFVLKSHNYACGAGGSGAHVQWDYIDVPDGHVATAYLTELAERGELIESYPGGTGEGLDGETQTFGVPSDFFTLPTLKATTYTLTLTITYEDGVTEKHIETLDLADLCDGRVNGAGGTTATTTTVPGGTLPATGSGNVTWVIGSLAGLLTTAGAALFAGARRARVD